MSLNEGTVFVEVRLPSKGYIGIKVGMHGQKFGCTRRQSILVAIRHDVGIVAEVVPQAESMSKFMGYCPKVKITRNQRNSATFAKIPIYSSGLKTMYLNRACTIVNDDEVIIRQDIKLKRAFAKIDFIKYLSRSRVVVIVPFGMLPIDAMHQRLASGSVSKRKVVLP